MNALRASILLYRYGPFYIANQFFLMWASGQRVVPARVDAGKVERNSLMTKLSISTIYSIGKGPMRGLVLVSTQWQLILMTR